MATIQGIYIALFGRPADPAGLAFFNEQTNNGADLTAIGDLAATDEYQDRFDGLNNVQIVTKIYQDLFGRDPDAAGLAFFVAALNAGTLDINNVAIAILDGAQGDDAVVVANKVAAANLFTSNLDTSIEIGSYVGDDAAASGRDFLAGITADEATVPSAEDAQDAIDAIVAAGVEGNTVTVDGGVAVTVGSNTNLNSSNDNDTINVSGATPYSDAVNINAGLGTDTVNITDLASNQAANLTSVERLFVTASAAAALDLVDVSGLQQVWNDTSTDVLTVNNIDAGVVLGLTGTSTDTNFNLEETSGDQSVTLVVEGATAGVVTIAGVEAITVDVESASTVNSLVGAAAEEVTVTGSGDLSLGATLAADAEVDASAHIGKFNFTVAGTQDGLTVVGGASNDTFVVTTDAEGIELTGGAGSDLFSIGILTNIDSIVAADVMSDMIEITDFSGTADLVRVDINGTAATFDNIDEGNIAAAANLNAALGVVAGITGANNYAVFQYQGSTYVYQNDADAAFDAGDGLVKITGFTGELNAQNSDFI